LVREASFRFLTIPILPLNAQCRFFKLGFKGGILVVRKIAALFHWLAS
jgi:hypothetical protein